MSWILSKASAMQYVKNLSDVTPTVQQVFTKVSTVVHKM